MDETPLPSDRPLGRIAHFVRTMNRSLRIRLLVLTAGLLLVLLGGFASVVYFRAESSVEFHAHDEIQSAFQLVSHRLLIDRAPINKELLDLSDHILIKITGANGQILIESNGIQGWLPENLPVPPPTRHYWNAWRASDHARLEVFSAPFEGGWLHVGRPMDSEDSLLRELRTSIIGFMIIGPLLAVLLGHILMGYGLAPLADLTMDAEHIRPETLNARFRASEVPTELAAFVHALNRTLDRLQSAFRKLADLNGDLAHELRTPVHALLLDCEGLLRRRDLPEEALASLEGMVGTLDHLGAMIEQMLALARMEDPSRGLHLKTLGVDLLVSEAVAPFRSLAEEKGISLRVDTGALATLQGDATLARRAIHNLLANAIRHSEGGGCVCVTTRRENGTAIIAVEDAGGGIPGELLSKVGQRFLKGETEVDQRGSGLGLVIVKKIMELHGGSLRLVSRLGQGTLAELLFPEF